MNGEKSRAAPCSFFSLGPYWSGAKSSCSVGSPCVYLSGPMAVCVCSVPPVCTAPRQNVLCVKQELVPRKKKDLRAPFGLVRLFFFLFFFFSFPRKKLTTFFRFAPDNLVCSPTHRNNPHCLCVCVLAAVGKKCQHQ